MLSRTAPLARPTYAAELRAAAAWHEGGNNLPPIPTIDSEVTVQRQDHALGVELGHPDEARVGQRHWNVREFLHQSLERIDLREHPEIDFQDIVGEKLENRILAITEPLD